MRNELKSDILRWLAVAAAIAVAFFIQGCYTQNKATEQVSRAAYKYPGVVADMTRRMYPCVTTKIERITDSASYNQWKDSVSKVNAFYEALMDSVEPEIITVTDTVADAAQIAGLKAVNDRLRTMVSQKDNYIKQLNYAISNVKPILIKEKEKVDDSAKLFLAQKQIDSIANKLNKSQATVAALEVKVQNRGKYFLWALVALFVSVVINVIQIKRK